MDLSFRTVGRGVAVGLLSLSVLVGGCATNGDTGQSNPFDFLASDSADNPNLTPEERALRKDAEIFNETVFGGAATGAALLGGLCVVGALLGNNNSLGRCAVLAGVGAAVGAVDGYLVAKRQEAARKQVREIDLVTQEMEEKNVKLRRLVATSKKVVEQNRERIRDVQIKVAQNQARQDELRIEKERLESNIDVMDETIASLKKERENYQDVADDLTNEGRNTTALRQEISEMNQQIAALERERNELEQINRAVRIG
ncbi:hypothetical protein [Minwuia sp.]|uniref:hypothetical protein n=1 Tax=Minwuia sp. TaxID=2493630 RepID=UPI003A93FEA7